jgi:LacI family transcriptional regulator
MPFAPPLWAAPCCPPPANTVPALQEMLRRDADGIIFDPSGLWGNFFQAYMDLILQSYSPISSLAGAHLLPNSIVPDHHQSGYLAASHLLDLGHRQIGVIAGPKESNIVSGLLGGVEEALEKWGLDLENLPVLFGANTALTGYEGLDALLRPDVKSREDAAPRRPTGIIAGSDAIAGGAGIGSALADRPGKYGKNRACRVLSSQCLILTAEEVNLASR